MKIFKDLGISVCSKSQSELIPQNRYSCGVILQGDPALKSPNFQFLLDAVKTRLEPALAFVNDPENIDDIDDPYPGANFKR